jgi:hypothetical protein
MFALLAAVLFVVAALRHGFHDGDWLFFTLFAFAAWALHAAYLIVLPHVGGTQQQQRQPGA